MIYRTLTRQIIDYIFTIYVIVEKYIIEILFNLIFLYNFIPAKNTFSYENKSIKINNVMIDEKDHTNWFLHAISLYGNDIKCFKKYKNVKVMISYEIIDCDFLLGWKKEIITFVAGEPDIIIYNYFTKEALETEILFDRIFQC